MRIASQGGQAYVENQKSKSDELIGTSAYQMQKSESAVSALRILEYDRRKRYFPLLGLRFRRRLNRLDVLRNTQEMKNRKTRSVA